MPKKVNKQNNNELDDTKWKKYTSDKIKDSKLLYYSGDIPETIYSITKEYIDKAKKIDKIISDVYFFHLVLSNSLLFCLFTFFGIYILKLNLTLIYNII